MKGFIALLFFVCCVWPCFCSWQGEWGVHVAEGADPQFLHRLGFEILKPIGNLQNAFIVRHTTITHEHPADQIEAAHISLQSHEHVLYTDKLHKRKVHKRLAVTFPDPFFADQWHLNNTGQPGQDINVTSVWNMGYTGNGVRIAVVDDGYQYTHPDLAAGYEADSSYNINSGNADPTPGLYDWHGTSAAGVALARNNSVCGVGAAYGAQGSGIRLIADAFSDADTAAALTFRYDLNDIYSNSWGPYDDGVTLEAPGYFTMAAFEDALKNGRQGKGSIYVWAAGNGLRSNDNCNYDGFANHRGTIAVGAVSNIGAQSYYSEPCSAMLVCAPSSGNSVGITTTDILGEDGYDETDCTSDFGGTSSACPLVAGVIALMLEANSDLTWRDVQYILLSTADKNDPTDPDWTTNGAGYNINHKYGFGRVNAYGAVLAAIDYENVKSSTSATYTKNFVNSSIPDNDVYTGVNTTVHVGSDIVVEHVEVTVNIPNFFDAGDLVVILTSPYGTQSILAEQHGNGYGIFLNSTALSWEYTCGPPRFGPQISTEISGQVVVPQPSSFACGNISNCDAFENAIAMVDYSPACNWTAQVYNVQQCGAAAVMVVYRFAGPAPNLWYTGDEFMQNLTIPSVMIPLDAGLEMKDVIEQNGNIFVTLSNHSFRGGFSYDGWTFSTVRNWGESSKGNWTLQVFDALEGAEAVFVDWDLTIYGHSKPRDLIPPWAVGLIAGFIVVIIFVTAMILYIRNKNRRDSGYREMP